MARGWRCTCRGPPCTCWRPASGRDCTVSRDRSAASREWALEKAGHVAPAEKLRQLQALGGTLYACGPSLQHFRVDPEKLAFDGVIVCEYLTFMEVMQQSDVQLYA